MLFLSLHFAFIGIAFEFRGVHRFDPTAKNARIYARGTKNFVLLGGLYIYSIVRDYVFSSRGFAMDCDTSANSADYPVLSEQNNYNILR